MTAETKIKLEDVQKSFGAKTVLSGINLSVQKGESLVVIGGSGTGKSVLIKCILGILRPEAGTIEVDGKNAIGLRGRQRRELLRQFGMLFQGGALFDSLPVWRNVAFGLIEAHRMKRSDAKEISIEMLRRVGLKPDVAELAPSELSGGMQKRVGLARAIAAKPEILFFDEPTTGLDPIMADVINELIVERVKDLGATAITITHDMASVRKIADHVAMLYEGKIIWHGKKDDVDHSENAYVDQFIHGRADGPIQMELLKR